MKEKLVLPPIATTKEKAEGSEPSVSQVEQLPPIRFYYISGRYQVCNGGFWNADLQSDFNAWLKHRRQLNDMKQQVDNQGITDLYVKYMKFRRRHRTARRQEEKAEIERQNRNLYARVSKVSTDLDTRKENTFNAYVQNLIRKRSEYTRFLATTKIARENTHMQSRLKAAKPWATAEEFQMSYAKLHKPEHRKGKNLTELKTILRKHSDSVSLSTAKSLQALSIKSEDEKKQETAEVR